MASTSAAQQEDGNKSERVRDSNSGCSVGEQSHQLGDVAVGRMAGPSTAAVEAQPGAAKSVAVEPLDTQDGGLCDGVVELTQEEEVAGLTAELNHLRSQVGALQSELECQPHRQVSLWW